jgi:CubicO group peptidase (beta-lactamase class C family)
LDSLAFAVITPAGPIFERGYGVLRANDTSAKQYPVDKPSIYRIASISKMFSVFETLLLRERGALELCVLILLPFVEQGDSDE